MITYIIIYESGEDTQLFVIPEIETKFAAEIRSMNNFIINVHEIDPGVESFISNFPIEFARFEFDLNEPYDVTGRLEFILTGFAI